MIALVGAALAIERDDVMVRASAYAVERWEMREANVEGFCDASYGYESIWAPGATYVGVPYDWGGYVTLDRFQADLAAGYGAGSFEDDSLPGWEENRCTTGVDCSGYVSLAWNTGHYYTWTLDQVTEPIGYDELAPGDILNIPDLHAMIYAGETDAGELAFFEANRNYERVHLRLAARADLEDEGYDALRYVKIEDGTPRGTFADPRVVDASPFHETFWMVEGPSRVLDGYACAPGEDRSGPEVIYRVDAPRSGRLTARVSDDVDGDAALFLLDGDSAADCVASGEDELDAAVGAGTWWIAVEPRVDAGDVREGAFAIAVDLALDEDTAAEASPAGEDDVPARHDAPADDVDGGCGCGGGGAPGLWAAGLVAALRRRSGGDRAIPPG